VVGYTFLITKKLCTSLTSDGALGYLADVHRDGGGDAADNGTSNQTCHVQLPDGGREVYHCPADDERHCQGGDGGFSAEYVRALAGRYGPDDGADGDQRTDPRPLVGRNRDPRVLGLQHGQHRRRPCQHSTYGERSDGGCNEKKKDVMNRSGRLGYIILCHNVVYTTQYAALLLLRDITKMFVIY
jgi:hypothetical protein